MIQSRSIIGRLFNGVNIKGQDECWLWDKSKNSSGYGKIKIWGKVMRVHRVMYELFNGYIDDDLFVCHTCDTPNCINPNHLFLGTNLDNMRDRQKKGRYDNTGIKNPRSKLTEQNVLEIKKLLKIKQKTHKEIAQIFNVARTTISAISRGVNWTSLSRIKT